jgi:hypothetical protein
LIQALTCQQFALFSLLFVGAAAAVALAQQEWHRGPTARLAAWLLGGCLLVYLVARGPLRIHEELGFERDAGLVASLSAHPSDFLSRPASAMLPFPPREDPTRYTEGLFPGILLLGLAALGAATPLPEKWRDRWRFYAIGACLAGFVLTLGLSLSFGGVQPFAALRTLPGFGQFRSVFRCAVFLQMHLVQLAALGLSELPARLKIAKPRAERVVIGAGLLTAVENLAVPAPLLPVPRSLHTASSAFLAAEPQGSVVAHVPFPRSGNVEDFAPETWRMLAQVEHGQPLVNGYASNFPAIHREFMFAMGSRFPDHTLACALRRVFSADLVVVDRDWLAQHRTDFGTIEAMMEPAYDDPAVAIFRLRPSESECPPMRIEVGPQR